MTGSPIFFSDLRNRRSTSNSNYDMSIMIRTLCQLRSVKRSKTFFSPRFFYYLYERVCNIAVSLWHPHCDLTISRQAWTLLLARASEVSFDLQFYIELIDSVFMLNYTQTKHSMCDLNSSFGSLGSSSSTYDSLNCVCFFDSLNLTKYQTVRHTMYLVISKLWLAVDPKNCHKPCFCSLSRV